MTHSERVERVRMPGGSGPDVLFVMPPGGESGRFSEHLGTAFLRAVLAQAGLRAEQYLPERMPSLRTFASFLAEARPAIVGFTAYETSLRACRAMARVVRETLPEATVLVGGPNATFTPDETLASVPADLCMRGAGEGTIAGVAAAILGAGSRARERLPDLLADVPNLVLRTPDGFRRTRPGDLSSFPREHFRHLDDLPSPYAAGLIGTADVGVLTARGCNQHCTYCSFAEISGRRVHFHGVERVLDDLAAFKKVVERQATRPNVVLVYDDAFTLAPERARAICEGIVARGLQLPLECQTRADRVDRDLLRLMRRAGFVSIWFGLESAVPRVLRAIGKVQDPGTRRDPRLDAERDYVETVRRAVVEARRAGLAPSVSVMAGLPAETARDFEATLACVRSLRVAGYAHNVLSILPGTPLFRERARFGLDAGRDPATGEWRTSHRYDVQAIAPLPNATLRASAWEEANEISDALCGIPRRAAADEGSAWAVVLHREAPDPDLAAWLREVLAVRGSVVVAGAPLGESAAHDRWFEALAGAEVPCGLVAVLARAGDTADGVALASRGTIAEHRFELCRRWRPCGPVDVDQVGRCRVRVWIASQAPAPPPNLPSDRLFARTPQIADGCRWWAGAPRCRELRVLHVWPDGAVTPCWSGPRLGAIGESYAMLRTRAGELTSAASADAPRCPLAVDGAGPARRAPRASAPEIASQLQWLLFTTRRRRA